jgi:hypothetical protein
MTETLEELDPAEKRAHLEQGIGELLDDLRKVGPEKPLGYLPISTLVKICRVNLGQMEEELKQRGLKTVVLGEEESEVDGGALYAYDEQALSSLLENNRTTLQESGWPTEPEAFVQHLKVSAGHKTDLFDLIAEAFGDKTNPLRKNP